MQRRSSLQSFAFFLCAFAPVRELPAVNPHLTRLLIAACALFAIYLLARLLTNRQVAVATVICFAFYPISLSETLLTQGREMTDSVPFFKALLSRLWQVTGHMGLFMLTLCGLLAMTRPPLSDNGVERRRIDIRAQIAMALVVAAYVIAQSFTGSEAREMLPVIPLAMLIWVSTLYRRVRAWRVVLGIICAEFLLTWLLSFS
jgi:hypothetical protein